MSPVRPLNLRCWWLFGAYLLLCQCFHTPLGIRSAAGVQKGTMRIAITITVLAQAELLQNLKVDACVLLLQFLMG